eukprot:g13559.t1
MGKESQLRAALRCVGFASGVIIGLIVYGVLQERIMSEPYDNEIFRTSVFLVFMNRVAAILFALLMVAIQGESYKASVPLWKYLAVSLSNVAATWCQYEALKYVTFPVQMLGKSFKMMPVMVWGILISGVTGGVTAFLMTGDIKSKHSEGSSAYGLLLLCCFLACDGFTSTFQEKLFKDPAISTSAVGTVKEHKTSKYNQMLYVNGSSSLVSAATLLVSGGFFQAMGFIGRHPNFIFDASILSASAVTGQFFIYSLEFGALVLAATMNMRQVLSILTSYIKYSHPISFLQILSLCAVFASLFYKSYLSYLKGKQPKEPKTPGKAEAIGKASVEDAWQIVVTGDWWNFSCLELQELKAEVPKEENENKN